MPRLTDPIDLGSIHAKSRILMAPLTRGRATREAVPTPVMADYYRQRASAGLIITEATGISRIGLGWPGAPGIYENVIEACRAAGFSPTVMAEVPHMLTNVNLVAAGVGRDVADVGQPDLVRLVRREVAGD